MVFSVEPLRQRLPRYLRDFAVAIVAAAVAGATVAAFTRASLGGGVGGALLALGVVLLLAGGLSGGGYVRTSGDYGIHYGKRHHEGLDTTEGDIARIQDLRARMRRELHPARNPAAFWQVIGGSVAAGMGVALLQLAS